MSFGTSWTTVPSGPVIVRQDAQSDDVGNDAAFPSGDDVVEGTSRRDRVCVFHTPAEELDYKILYSLIILSNIGRGVDPGGGGAVALNENIGVAT